MDYAQSAFEESLERMAKATEIAVTYGGIDGAHHKQWVIDQMLRALSGGVYEELIPEDWDEGVVP